ncbi:MAG: hypothetical protein EXS35_17325 [Pedosphaera sp.]|nr:hypothetical protein [Pedosphaera sp.]
MTWLSSFSIAILSGVLGLVCAGGISALCVEWYRVSSFEGKSGYFVVFTAILGGLAAFVIGLTAARWVAGGAAPGFLKGLGVACGVVLGIALVALALCRLFADLAPELDGKPLELEIEVRCPKNFAVPAPDEYGATAEVYLPGGRRLPFDNLRLNEAKTVDEQHIVPATVPLTTSAAKKFLQVRFNAQHNLLFNLPLLSHPQTSDREWSKWIESGWDAGKPEPAKEAKFSLRFRVRTVEPEPPAPDPAEVRAQEFAALKPDAPLEEWLPFLFEEPNAERTKVVIEHINVQQADLAKLLRSKDAQMREHAFRAVDYAEKPAPEVVEAVLAEGRDIAAGIRKFNELPEDDPKFHNVLLDLRTRFNYWKQAWWTIHQRLGVDGRPPVQTIYDLATVRARGTAMDEIEVNARVFLEALNKSTEEKKP